MRWSWLRFEQLGVHGLYDILALRCRVFILEQGPFLDTDGADAHSWHLQGRDEAGVLQAYLRAVDPGVKYAEPSIGRVITAPEVRGTGLGRALMREGLARCAAQWPGQGVRISAQSRLHHFYAGMGFAADGDDYLEDGIPPPTDDLETFVSELILHHYPMSPFAEKVRLMLGYKRLPWRSVIIPPVMPKPDVVALTGGYRKTPILQIGADVYCDTALIARVLEARQPVPTLYPSALPLAVPLAQWADGMLFPAAVSWAMQPAGAAEIMAGQPPEVLKAFAADRAAMRANAPRPTLADATAQLRQHLTALSRQLQRGGGPWLLGTAPSIADFSAGHCLWFIRLAKPVAALLDEYPAVQPWLDRLFAIGHHESSPMSSSDALAAAAGAGAHAPTAVEPGLGFEAGQSVTVSATDYGTDPVAGTLVGLNGYESVLRRSDPRAGTVHVHFPRAGFQLRADKKA